MISALPAFSQKLLNILNIIEKETERKVKIECVPSVGLQGMNFAFFPHPSLIKVLIVFPYSGTLENFEQSIAHEATHGLLLCSKGYCSPEHARLLTPSESFSISTMGTMVDDVVVNRIIEAQGFPPVGSVYFDMVRRETKAAQSRDTSIYRNTGPDQVSINRFMIYRYVNAWANFHYFKLSLIEKKNISSFRKAFAEAYRELDIEAKKIQRLFEENDVLTPEGHEVIIKGVLSLWGLNNAINLTRETPHSK